MCVLSVGDCGGSCEFQRDLGQRFLSMTLHGCAKELVLRVSERHGPSAVFMVKTCTGTLFAVALAHTPLST